MSKYFHNNTKLLILSGVLAGALVFSPALSSLALAEGTQVTEATATTATTDVAEATASTESSATTETTAVTAATETTAATEAVASTEAAASTTSTDDNGATIVRFYDPEVGWNTRINLVVGAYGTQYNGNAYIPATISDNHKSFTFDGNIQREGYTLVGYSSETLLSNQRDNATPDQSMPYTVDANGIVHVNFADITAWSVTDDLRDDTTTYYYFLLRFGRQILNQSQNQNLSLSQNQSLLQLCLPPIQFSSQHQGARRAFCLIQVTQAL